MASCGIRWIFFPLVWNSRTVGFARKHYQDFHQHRVEYKMSEISNLAQLLPKGKWSVYYIWWWIKSRTRCVSEQISLVFQEALLFVQLCVSLLTACLSTVMRIWCSRTTWLCASAPAWWEGPATKMLSLCSLWSTPWWRTSSCSTRASSPARANCKGRCTRNAWPWSRTTGEGKDIHSVHTKCCGNVIIWGFFFLFQRAHHWRGRSRSRNHSE